MKIKIEQIGNFYGFIIPREILEALDFGLEENYYLEAKDQQLTIAKSAGELEAPKELSEEDLDAFSSFLEES